MLVNTAKRSHPWLLVTLSRVFLFVIIFIGVAFVRGGYGKTTVEIGMETIKEDTTWSGEILITGDVYVPLGVTLTIAPGTLVRFKRIDEQSGKNLFRSETPYYPQAELIIRGRLVAQGTRDNIITFTSAEKNALVADWGAINLLGSDDNVIEYCKILFAYNGIHAHSSTALISHNILMNNGVAISFKRESSPDEAWYGKDTDITVINNDIHNNKGGINVRNSKTLISYNRIRNNKFFGIWVKEKNSAYISFNDITGNYKGVYLYQASGLKIHFNNIYSSKQYNITIADEQDYEVDARYNWFGTTNKEKIDDLIFDRHDDPAVANILYEPISGSKIKGAGNDFR